MFYCNLFLCLRGSAANAYSFRHEEVLFHHGETFVPSRDTFCSTMVERINIGNAPF